MIGFGGYFRAALKRAMKLLPVLIIVSSMLIGVLCLAFSTMSASNDKLKFNVPIGIVGDKEGEHLGLGFMVLDKMDTSAVAVNFIPYEDEAQARADVRDSKLSAYLYIPEGFLESVLSGENTPMTLYTADRTDNLIPSLVREMSGYASGYVTDSQRSIRAMRNCVREFHIDEVDMDTVTTDLNLKYITMVTGRGSQVKVVETGEMGTISFGGYYLCAFVFVFLMLFSIMATPLFAGNRRRLSYYRSYGVGCSCQVVAEYLAYSLMVLFLMCLIFMAVAIFIPEGLVPELVDPVVDISLFFISALPSMMLIFSISYFLWELVPETVNGVIMQFVVAVGLGYISGCFYPSKMFAEGLRNFAAFLPTGRAISGLQNALTGETDVWGSVLALLFAALFVGAAVILRRRRTEGGAA